jgi:hypothetical protein
MDGYQGGKIILESIQGRNRGCYLAGLGGTRLFLTCAAASVQETTSELRTYLTSCASTALLIYLGGKGLHGNWTARLSPTKATSRPASGKDGYLGGNWTGLDVDGWMDVVM